ncbi:hypothetical protein SDC9_173013 [bioreactor metagenome]|uniref:Uncharacterized protein n=1 Tax=bioreactor metagenome TaxID=1076179 RepID=A0A645GFA8_9ZZZZ
MAGDDQLGGSGFEPLLRVVERDAAADLKAARPGGQRPFRRRVVAGAEFDHMPAVQPVFAVEFGEPGGVAFGHEIGGDRRVRVRQRGADDLFDQTAMQIDAGAEKTHFSSVSR